jgi:hypothetical protein
MTPDCIWQKPYEPRCGNPMPWPLGEPRRIGDATKTWYGITKKGCGEGCREKEEQNEGVDEFKERKCSINTQKTINGSLNMQYLK